MKTDQETDMMIKSINTNSNIYLRIFKILNLNKRSEKIHDGQRCRKVKKVCVCVRETERKREWEQY